MISFVPSLFPLNDGRTLEKLFPSRYTLNPNSTGIGMGKYLNSMVTTVYKVSGDKEKANEEALVFINNDINSDEKARIASQIPSIILFLDRKEMEDVNLESSKIPGVSLEKRTNSVIFMKLKGGSFFLLSTLANVDSTISEASLTSSEDQKMAFTNRKENSKTIAMNSVIMGDLECENKNDLMSLSKETSNESTKYGESSKIKSFDSFPPPPRFNTLSVVSINAERRSFQINSRDGVFIENEFFVGRIILVLKPQNPKDDPYYNEKIFSKKRRVFEMKFQGRFKYKPDNTIFCGLEITERMKLGFVTKGLCNMLLKLLSKVNDDLHFSFGDKNNEEYAHIAFPIYTFAESFVETKPGNKPPPFENDFPESSESKKRRKKSKEDFDWKLDHTYSISFHSMYLNLSAWELINLPMMKNIDLSTFWGEASLRIVLYEKIGKSTQHLKRSNQYIGGIELSYVANSDKFEIDPKNDETKEDVLPWDKVRPAMTRSFDSYSNLFNSSYDRDDNDDIKVTKTRTIEESDETDYSMQGSETDNEAEYSQVSLQSLTLDIDNVIETYYDAKSRLSIQPYKEINRSNFSRDDFCPCRMDLFGSNKKYKTMYSFCAGDGMNMVFRSSQNFVEHFQFCVKYNHRFPNKLSRFSSRERMRRILGETLVKMENDSFPTFQEKIETFITTQSQDKLFLQKKIPVSISKAKLQDDATVNCCVARFLNKRHAREEWAIVCDKYISFYGIDKKKHSFRILRRCIVSVKAGSNNHPAYSKFHFLEIETIGKITYLMFRTQDSRDHWLEKLSNKSLTDSDSILTVDCPAGEFLQRSSLWKSKKRCIFNSRKFFFEGPDLSDHESQVGDLHPCEIVKDALSRVLQLHDNSSNTTELISFLNIVSSLQTVNANKLKENEKKAFFLNLYHLMVNHAFLVMGFPTSTYNFISYFATICYQCSDDVFSISELEHCIIRAQGSPPSNFVSKFVIPSNQYEFSLGEKDNRINFALNCGSKSNSNLVSLFTPELIEQQLDYNSRVVLGGTVAIKQNDRKGVCIKLPRICNWYLGDFGNGQIDLLRFVRNYIPDDKKKLIDLCLTGSVSYVVKYLPFVFKCQNLALMPDDESLIANGQ